MFVGAYVILQSSEVQTYLTNKVSKYFLEKYNAKLTVKKIDITFLNRVVFHDVYIEDTKKDTLVFLKDFEAHLLRYDFEKNWVYLDKIVVDNVYANLYEDSAKVMNFQFLLDAFASNDSTPKDTAKSDLKIFCQNFDIKNTRFSYKKYKPEDLTTAGKAEIPHGINFNNLSFTDFNLGIRGLIMRGDTIDVHFENVSIKEKSGFELDTLKTWLRFTNKNINLIDFALVTPNTNFKVPLLKLGFDSLGDFSDFLNKVNITAKIEKSKIGADDFAFFVPDLWGINQSVAISGEIKGKVCDIKAKNLDLRYGKYTVLQTNFTIKGLPDINKTVMHVDVKRIKTNKLDLAKIMLPPYSEKHPLPLPVQLDQMGNVGFQGSINGGLNDIAVKGIVTTDIGNVVADVNMQNDTVKKIMKFAGKVQTIALHAGKLSGNEAQLGLVTANFEIKGRTYAKNLSAGQAGKIDLQAKGLISSAAFNGYTYSNINLDASLLDKKIDTKLTINDPSVNLKLTAQGELIGKKASVKITLDIDRADLRALNFNKADSMSLVSLQLYGDLNGSNPDDIVGDLVLAKVYYANQKGSISMQDFFLNVTDYFTYKKITLNSDLLDVNITGKYQFAPLISSFSNVVYNYLPSLAPANYKAIIDTVVNDIRFDIKIKRTDEICKLFAPNLSLSPKTRITGTYNSLSKKIAFRGSVPEIKIDSNKITNLNIDSYTENNVFSINIEGNKIAAGGLITENLNINADIKNDSILLRINNQNKEAMVFGTNLTLLTYFTKPQNYKSPIINIEIKPSEIILGDVVWTLPDSKIIVDSTAIKLENFKLQNKQQFININGKISAKPSDTLMVQFNKVDLAGLNILTGDSGPNMTGRLDGYASVNDLYNKILFNSDISVKGFTLNQEMLGNTFIKTNWDENTKKIALQVYTKIGKVKTLSINGDYTPASKEIAFDINLNRLKLNILQPYMVGILSDLKGEVNGNFNIKGTTDKPLIEGSLDILETYFTLDFSKVRYCIKNSIQVTNNQFIFEEFNIFDPNWKMLVLNGSITHKNFQDIRLDLIMNTTDDAFLFLNTEETDNSAFYGIAYMTGVFKIKGPPENIVVDIAAKTEKDTYFYIPLSSSSDVNESDFITFTKKSDDADTLKVKQSETTNLSGVTLNFDLEITPDAEAQIVFDAKTGDLIKGRGNSNLKIEINTMGKFNMYGDFIIDRGDYLFTLQNIINKKFDVEKGGTISWNGDPLDATVDLKAVYRLKAPLSDLFPGDESDTYKKRTSIECKLGMTNKLMEPIITFDIDLPTADENAKSVLKAFSTDEKNKQFLFLLVLNRFMVSPPNENTAQSSTKRSSNVGGVTSSELLSNQLSHWLSQISNDFDVGVNYRPGDEISSEQVEVALSTQILNDRVAINGNVGIGQQKSTSSGVVGDFDIAYKITKNGKLRVKAFTKANDQIMDNSSPYTQGMGLYYKEDFNSVGELFRRYKNYIFPKKEL